MGVVQETFRVLDNYSEAEMLDFGHHKEKLVGNLPEYFAGKGCSRAQLLG